jgi:hypothetical protein
MTWQEDSAVLGAYEVSSQAWPEDNGQVTIQAKSAPNRHHKRISDLKRKLSYRPAFFRPSMKCKVSLLYLSGCIFSQ